MTPRRTLAALILLSAATAFAGTYAGIQPVGAFARVTGPKDSADGYRARLWRDGNRLLGEFTVLQSGEAQTGTFKDGTIDEKGKAVFAVPIDNPDNPSAKPLSIAVEAQVTESKLDGLLWWQAERERHAEDSAAEKISLPLDKSVTL
ncbi:MAG: hypothetical protein JO102_03630, partial [Elusimicrobia bacterium]|nr:hypothetical protein [Elusimicrobiota bacterium]